MSSFIIPSGFLGLVSPRTIYFDNGIQISKKAPVVRMAFGDGFKSDLKLGFPRRTAGVTLANREPEEINLVENYIIALGGAYLPSLTIMSQSWSGRVSKFSKDYQNGEIYSLSMEITEN